MKKIREEKGITLVALIITIIVLLILAVVAISAVTGDGIIQHASNAKTSYENAQAVENSKIGEYEAFLNKHNPNKKIIKFYIIISSYDEKIECTAEEGMTWGEFLSSKYNTTYTHEGYSGLEFSLKSEGNIIRIREKGTNNWEDFTFDVVETDGTTAVKVDTVITTGKQWQAKSLMD